MCGFHTALRLARDPSDQGLQRHDRVLKALLLVSVRVGHVRVKLKHAHGMLEIGFDLREVAQ